MVSEQEDDPPGFAGGEMHLDLLRANRLPAQRDGIRAFSLFHCLRGIPSAVRAQEGIPVRIETDQRLGAGEEGKVVAPFPVFRFVINNPARNLHLADRIVSLEIVGIIHRIPKAEFHSRENRKLSRTLPLVGELQAPDLQVFAGRDEDRARRLRCLRKAS